MKPIPVLKNWFEENRKKISEDFFSFLQFPSISADPSFKKATQLCAEWLCSYIRTHTSLRAECLETEGFPLVYAEDLRAGAKKPTLLIYGHYDVQPVDPIELWQNDPFKPVLREGKIYARGAVDDKGQIFYAILALQAWKSLGWELPINLKFCIEGEEESSSVGFAKSLPKLKEKLQADALLVIDFDQFDQETPALSLGARGLAALEVTLQGSNNDLHSGFHGGMAYNPNRALVELLAKLWDENGRVAVPGFYDDVLEPSAEEQSRFTFRYEKEDYSKEFGIEAFGGEKGVSLGCANYFRPTLELNGICGGYIGPGIKTVIPSHASAKITCRLVPKQDPHKVSRLIASFLKENVTAGMKIIVRELGGEPAFRGRPDSSLAKAVAKACQEVTGKECKYILSGGSIPIVANLLRILECDVVGMGYGLPTDNIHAPNEHFDFARLEKGFLTVARTLQLL